MHIQRNFLNLDAGESIFFSRELEHILTRQHDIQYPELRVRMFVPVNNEAGPGAESITYYQFDKVGIAKIISDYSADLPRADVFGQKFTSPVESLGISFGYSVQEVRSAAMAQRSLPTMKANAAREAHERLVDEIGSLGDATTGLTGFVNNANVPTGSALNGSWATATADQIIEDMNESVTSMINSTNAVEVPDTILLPIQQFTIVNQRRIPDTEITVLQFFLRNSAFIRNVDHWYRLDGAGAASSDRMITYRRDPSKMELHIPQEYETFPVQEKGLEFMVPTHSRIGGTVFYKPFAALYRDGI
jgi:hypothetical protein